MTTYTQYDQANPLGTQDGPDAIATMKANFLALRDNIIMGGAVGYVFSQSGGTAAQPASLFFKNSSLWVSADLTWSSGRISVMAWKFSPDGGSTYLAISTDTFTYDSAGYLTGVSDGCGFLYWILGRLTSPPNGPDGTFVDAGTHTSFTLDLAAAHTFRINPSANFTIAFSHVPASGIPTEVLIEFDNAATFTGTYPGTSSWGSTGEPTWSSGSDKAVAYTRDGGTTWSWTLVFGA